MQPSFEHADLVAAWDATLRREPRATAILSGGAAWTREQLEEESGRCRRALPFPARLRGRRVALAEPNGLGWCAKFIAILRTGGIPALLDAGEPRQRLADAARDLGASWLWSEGGLVALDPRPVARGAELCLLKVTSGSTGRPRGLAFTHGQMLADGRQVCQAMGIQPGDVNLAVIPFGHSYGLGNLVVPLLAQGTACACADNALPGCVARMCVQAGATVFPAVPAILRGLLKSRETADALASLRLVISAGAPIAPEDAAAFRERFGLPVHVFYGSTETGGITFDATGTAAEEGRSVGRPMPGVAIRFGSGGRFNVDSAAVMGRGSFRPADRGELSASGELRLLGRVGRIWKLGGRRLDLAGLESEMLRVPGVRGVIIEPHPGREEALAALVATDHELGDLKVALGMRLPAWKIPARLRVVREIPLTPRGKIDRARARGLLAD